MRYSVTLWGESTVHWIGLFCADAAFVVLAAVLSLLVRYDFVLNLDRLWLAMPYIGCSIISAVVVIWAFGLYRSIWRLSSSRDYERLLYAALAIVLGSMALGFAIDRLKSVPRSLPALQLGFLASMMVMSRAIARRLRTRRARATTMLEHRMGGWGGATVLLIGLNSLAEFYLQMVSQLTHNEVEVVGILGRNERHVGRLVQNCTVLGTPEDAKAVLQDLEMRGITVDRIVFATPIHKLSNDAVSTLKEIERSTDITLHSIADELGAGFGAGVFAAEDRRSVAHPVFSPSELRLIEGRLYFRIKRVLDVIGASFLIVAFAPLIVLISICVAIDVGAPIMFAQRRPGLGGRPFFVYKFRSMFPGYDSDGNRIPDEERSSALGRMLRRFRFDELPQLYNVLIGEMSFVGPRPLLPIDQRPEYKARLLVRPGLTGWAQVEGGRIINAADKAALDVWYVQNASLSLDLAIIARTIRMIIVGDRVNLSAIERAWEDLEAAGVCADWEHVRNAAKPNTRRAA